MSELLTALNDMSPLAVIALLAYVVYLLVRNKKSVHSIATNHLHSLPEMAATLERIEAGIVEGNRQHTDMLVMLSHVKARLNGRDK